MKNNRNHNQKKNQKAKNKIENKSKNKKKLLKQFVFFNKTIKKKIKKNTVYRNGCLYWKKKERRITILKNRIHIQKYMYAFNRGIEMDPLLSMKILMARGVKIVTNCSSILNKNKNLYKNKNNNIDNNIDNNNNHRICILPEHITMEINLLSPFQKKGICKKDETQKSIKKNTIANNKLQKSLKSLYFLSEELQILNK